MEQLRTYLPSAFVALAVLSYMIFPFAYQEASSAFLSFLAAGVIVVFVFINGRLPHPVRFTASQWLALSFIAIQVGIAALSHNFTHAFFGFSFDTMSAAFLITVFLLTLLSDGLPQKTRKVLFITALVGLVLLILYPLVRSQVHVRPSNEVTMLIESSVYAEQGTKALLFGTGQNSFTYAWQKHRPQAVIATAFWNEDFPTGGSVVLTSLIETGVVSTFLLVIIFIVAFAEECWREVVRGYGRIPRIKALFCAGTLLVAVCALGFGEPSSPLILVSGILLATFRQTEKVVFVLSTLVRRVLVGVGCVLLAFVAYIGVSTALYFYSFSYVLAGDYARARIFVRYAYSLHEDPQIGRLYAQIMRSMAHEFGRVNAPVGNVQDAFKEASLRARESTAREPRNEQNWKLLGISLAEQLALEKKKAYLDEGIAAFDQAQKRSPLDPAVPFFRAQLYILAGDKQKAAEALDAALLLRPAYTEARELREALRNAPAR